MRSRIARAVILAASLAGAWSAGPARAQEAADEYEARLAEVKGEVTVFTSEEPDGVPGDQDMPLAPGDRVKTAAEGSAEVVFSGEHCVLLRSGSELAVTSVKRSGCVLTLALGSLLAKVQALAGGGFQVRTPGAVASVRGTEFGVEVDPAQPDQTHVGVFDEGKVEVSGQAGQPELLKSNQETSVRRGARPQAAYQLRRFARHRQFMRAFRKRVQALRKGWRPLGLQQRLAKRREMLQRQRQVREQRLEKARQKAPDKLRGRKGAKALRPDQEKMEKRKKAIRDRLRRPGN